MLSQMIIAVPKPITGNLLRCVKTESDTKVIGVTLKILKKKMLIFNCLFFCGVNEEIFIQIIPSVVLTFHLLAIHKVRNDTVFPIKNETIIRVLSCILYFK